MSSEQASLQSSAPVRGETLPPFADFGTRVVAFLIDVTIVVILVMVGSCGCGSLMTLLLVSLESPLDPISGGGLSLICLSSQCLIWLVPYLIVLAYHSLQLPRGGQTIGKRVMKIQVVSSDGNPPTFVQALGRTLAYTLSELIFFIGYFFPLFDESHQALHDKVAGTYVVKRSD